MSRSAPQSVATTGTPAAIDSITLMGAASWTDDRQDTSKPAAVSGTSRRKPGEEHLLVDAQRVGEGAQLGLPGSATDDHELQVSVGLHQLATASNSTWCAFCCAQPSDDADDERVRGQPEELRARDPLGAPWKRPGIGIPLGMTTSRVRLHGWAPTPS